MKCPSILVFVLTTCFYFATSEDHRMKCPSILVFVLTTCCYFATSEMEVALTMGQCGSSQAHDLVHNIKNRKGFMELFYLEGHVKTHPKEMYQEDCAGMTPVHYLVEGRYIRDLLMAFINADFNLNHRFDKVNTILFHAVKHGHLDTIRTLLEFGSFVDMDNYDGSTPLFEAVKRMRKDVCQLLLENGANIRRSFSGGDGYLHRFVDNGTTEHVNLLVKLGAPMDMKNEQGLTPIDVAILKDRISMLNVFLIETVNCSSAYNLWREPLAFAVSNGTHRALDLILSRIVQEPCSPINYFKDAFYTAIKVSSLGYLNMIYNKGQEKGKEFFQRLYLDPEWDPIKEAIKYNSTISLDWFLKKELGL